VLYDAKRGRSSGAGSALLPEPRVDARQGDALAGGVPEARTQESGHRTADEPA
jgi:hypothetical protein